MQTTPTTATTQVRKRTRPASDDSLDILWGYSDIAKALGVTRRRAEYLVTIGEIPARKVGAKWCISRRRLREVFDA